MTRLKLILLLFIGLLCLNEVYAASKTIQLTQKMYDDLATKDFINYMKETAKIKDIKAFEDLNKIEDYKERLKVAKKKYPAVYKSMKEYFDAVDAHKARLDSANTREFYEDYMDTVVDNLNPHEPDLKDSFVKFMKIVIPKWNKLNQKSKDAFKKQFPNIAKILNDKNIQAMVDGDKSITIKSPSIKKSDENQPKKSLWQRFKALFHG